MTNEEKKKVCGYLQQLWNERIAYKELFDVREIELWWRNYKWFVQECFDVKVKVVDGKVVIE